MNNTAIAERFLREGFKLDRSTKWLFVATQILKPENGITVEDFSEACQVADDMLKEHDKRFGE